MISDELIRQAVQEYDAESMSTIPTEPECDHIFSDRFDRKMKSVSYRRGHPLLSRTLRMAASFALVLLVTVGSVLALSPAARGAVVGWIFGYSDNVYSYTATGEENGSETILKYSISDIPEDYTLLQDYLGYSNGITIYAQEPSGRLFKILFSPNDGSSALFLIPESAEKTTVQLNNIAADFYLSNSEEESSCIVWVDPQTDYLICIDGFFSQEELIRFAANVTITEVPRPE